MEFKDMTIEELESRKAAIATEIDAPEADLDALGEEVRGINEELENRKAAEAKKVEVRKAVAEGAGEVVKKFEKEERKTMTNAEIRNSAEYIEAYANAIRHNDGNFTECRELLTENANGAVPVPSFVYGIVSKRLEESEILRRVRHMNARGNVSIGFEISAPAAAVHLEGGEAQAEEDLQLGIVNLTPKTLKKWVSISDEALDAMSGQAYLEYIYDEVARGIIKAREDVAVALILAAPQTATQDQPAVAKYVNGGTATIADFVQARALLSSAARDLVIICSPAQYAAYRALQMGSNYGADPFDGLPVLFSDAATYPIIGDLSGILENLPKGDDIEFKYDDRTRMKQDLVDILGRQPVAMGVVGNLYFAKITAS